MTTRRDDGHAPSASRYRSGCRCEGCREAHRAYYRAKRREWAAARANNAPASLVDAEPVRRKLGQLAERGYSVAEISRLSGVAKSTIRAIMRPEDAGAREKVRRGTKDALFAIRGRRHLRAGTLVDASRVASELRRWSRFMSPQEISDATGICTTVVYDLMAGKERISATTLHKFLSSRAHVARTVAARREEGVGRAG